MKTKIPFIILMSSVFTLMTYVNVNDLNSCKNDYFSFLPTAYASGASDGTCDGGGAAGGPGGDGNGDGIINSLDCPSGLVYIAAGGYCSSCLPNAYYDSASQACYYNTYVPPSSPAPIVHIWFTE